MRASRLRTPDADSPSWDAISADSSPAAVAHRDEAAVIGPQSLQGDLEVHQLDRVGRIAPGIPEVP